MSQITPTMGYLTTDAKFFKNRNEALAHQHAIDLEEDVRAFLGDRYDALTQRITILQWEEYKKLKQLEDME